MTMSTINFLFLFLYAKPSSNKKKKAAKAHLMRAYLQVLFINNSIDPFKFALL